MTSRFSRSLIVAALVATFGVSWTSVAAADEPVAASEPRLMSETAEITSVVDAFDRDDPFDLHITAGFQQMWKHADIHRETQLSQFGLSTGGFVPTTENVGLYSQSQSILNLGLDIGLFRDFAIVARLPVILSDSREITDLSGSSNNPQRLQDPSGGQLFSVPFKSYAPLCSRAHSSVATLVPMSCAQTCARLIFARFIASMTTSACSMSE